MLALVQGFEPRLADPESVVLPLYYTRMCVYDGWEPRELPKFWLPSDKAHLVLPAGLKPTTDRFVAG